VLTVLQVEHRALARLQVVQELCTWKLLEVDLAQEPVRLVMVVVAAAAHKLSDQTQLPQQVVQEEVL